MNSRVNLSEAGQLALWQQRHGEHYSQPSIEIDRAILRRQARRFCRAMPRVEPHFAVKANPHPAVLATLAEEGVFFEIASKKELDTLLDMGADSENIFYSNPIKSAQYIQYAAAKGVCWFVVDSVEEVEKIADLVPQAKLYLRLHTSNKGSLIELSSKFGAFDEEADAIIERATALGVDLCGVTFHVGSQCCNSDNWRIGIEAAIRCFEKMKNAGLTPELLDIGGGFPVAYEAPVATIEEIATVINKALLGVDQSVRIIAEPGRYLVAEAGRFYCQVIGSCRREGRDWLYLDSGFYGGLLELKEGLHYPITSLSEGEPVPWVIAGPTCDSVDICSQSYPLPAGLKAGDFIMLNYVGAYSNACACEFNGFPLPEVVML
ncbi:Lysine/ornithine decarboxylase [Sinobacterium norvegicum]|uniref:ornithine decarboxylase n=1 Tax=Sinobacterium norvegicum TaxID=1641715 RepID=A0ABN8EN13_9GAMM|nr:type III PLP-dependent enzyme [Sinobacterium norvegicum]CAH0992332.1 Lysine/ornithine decarboxylase [Sinobacterium norvegicum]